MKLKEDYCKKARFSTRCRRGLVGRHRAVKYEIRQIRQIRQILRSPFPAAVRIVLWYRCGGSSVGQHYSMYVAVEGICKCAWQVRGWGGVRGDKTANRRREKHRREDVRRRRWQRGFVEYYLWGGLYCL
jgi:hypothetical protein